MFPRNWRGDPLRRRPHLLRRQHGQEGAELADLSDYARAREGGKNNICVCVNIYVYTCMHLYMYVYIYVCISYIYIDI